MLAQLHNAFSTTGELRTISIIFFLIIHETNLSIPFQIYHLCISKTLILTLHKTPLLNIFKTLFWPYGRVWFRHLRLLTSNTPKPFINVFTSIFCNVGQFHNIRMNHLGVHRLKIHRYILPLLYRKRLVEATNDSYHSVLDLIFNTSYLHVQLWGPRTTYSEENIK